ncbi:pyridoxal phosphate-dependent decarboxylase family protein [Sulfitobacter guttiformis]|uniref:Aromatic-L-amino-acid decarboxylase n=1 Tax=Sulfitobacter guttiformis TaxID=74349 RepID=A0A420DUC1_9RHOB|nr:pyridoxal-dependent decarboxylase [Sulfitobacter guttiformis]KIN71334.1 Aromatic-L-amino-acid decarboxylase [Sulfitobacter guttiformis KCTC 32187]RKE97783.1 aromatic-L-amino-acid decarboxylase [Sulfitobacter guttiformis]
MNWDEFEHWGAHIARWAADYHKGIRDLPVRAQTEQGDIAAALPVTPPEAGEAMEQIIADFERIVMPGITHWQHPRFFAYFPANAAPPSMLAEMLVSTIAAQSMLWQTSPAATEMEGVMIDWLRQALGLPDGFKGVIQDSASSATLSAVLTMREIALNWRGNKEGLSGLGRLRIYCSQEVHSSVDRAIWVAGIGQDNLVKIGNGTSGHAYEMDTEELAARITQDRAAGYIPAGIIAITGGTGIGAYDFHHPVLAIAKAEGLYTHLDAAWAGAAMICPEYRDEFWAGVEGYDSIVFNPHKWLGAQFDCSVQFLRDPQHQINTLKIEPEYLKTAGAPVTNYSEWTIPLGRRFRALKLWFLIRSYGLEGLRARIRNHVDWAHSLAARLDAHPDFEVVTQPILSLFTFKVMGRDDSGQLAFVERLNNDGRIYITQTRVKGAVVIRFQIGQFDCSKDDINTAYDVLCELVKP